MSTESTSSFTFTAKAYDTVWHGVGNAFGWEYAAGGAPSPVRTAAQRHRIDLLMKRACSERHSELCREGYSSDPANFAAVARVGSTVPSVA